jgi:DNA-binding CsgD family transcriptional regulator
MTAQFALHQGALAPAFPQPARPDQRTSESVGGDAASVTRTLEEALRQLAWRFGLQGGHYVHLGHAIRDVREDSASPPVRFIATSVSDRRLFLDEYGLTFDPTARRIAHAHTPFSWTAAAEGEASDGQRWLAGRLKGRGVHGGIAAPVQDYAAGPAYISLYSAFSGEAEQLIAARGPELAYAAASFHEQAKSKLPAAGQNGVRSALTAREIDCLRLAALGRTVTETADALQVTPRTVEFHLKNAAEKFGASNKLRAVALAISRGLITLWVLQRCQAEHIRPSLKLPRYQSSRDASESQPGIPK